MKNLLYIISKNLKLLIRSRSSALIIILAPLLVILLVGVAFDNANIFGLTIGVYSDSFGPNVDDLLSQLAEKELQVIKYDTQEKCIDDIKQGVTNTCIIFPPELDFESNEQKQITFHVDYSKINLVWMIMDTLNARFGTSSKEISEDLIGILVNKLTSSQTELESKKSALNQLKTENLDSQGKVEGITVNLKGFNFAADNETFNVTGVEDQLNKVKINLSKHLTDVRKRVESAKEAVGNTSDVGGKLENALDNLYLAEEIINGATPPSFIRLETLFNTLKTNIENAKVQLTQANQLRETAVPKLDNVKEQLDQSLANVNNLEATFNSIINEIQSIKVTNPEAIAQPFVTEIKPVAAPSTYLNYLFPSLIILVVMFISMLLSTTLVMMEKHSPAYFRNFITPTRDITFIMGTFITNMLLVGIQLAIILLIAGYFFSAQIVPSLSLSIAILVLAATFFTLWGMVVGYLFTSEETATLATISSGSIFLFLSSVIIPLESMPMLVRKIAEFNPFVICERVLREVLLFQPKISAIADDLLLIGGYSIALFIFILAFQGFMSRHFVQRLTYYRHKRQREEMQHREQRHFEENTKKTKPQKKDERIIENDATKLQSKPKPISFGLHLRK